MWVIYLYPTAASMCRYWKEFNHMALDIKICHWTKFGVLQNHPTLYGKQPTVWSHYLFFLFVCPHVFVWYQCLKKIFLAISDVLLIMSFLSFFCFPVLHQFSFSKTGKKWSIYLSLLLHFLRHTPPFWLSINLCSVSWQCVQPVY